MTKPRKNNEITGPGGISIVELGPSYDFLNSIQIWQGAPKTGKTSTAAALKEAGEKLGIPIKPFFMLFEPGSGGVTITGTSQNCACNGKKNCEECEGLGVKRLILSTLDEIDKWFTWYDTSEYNIAVIDTADAMFQVISDGICINMGIINPTQSDHGTAWIQIYDMVREKIALLTRSGKAVIMLMHIYYQERRLRGGATIQTATFNVSGRSRQYLAGLANQILHFEITPGKEDDRHIIRAKQTAGIEAGDHWGLLPEEVDRGSSPLEGAEALLRCFYD